MEIGKGDETIQFDAEGVLHAWEQQLSAAYYTAMAVQPATLSTAIDTKWSY